MQGAVESASSLRSSTAYILLPEQRLWRSSFPALLTQLQKTRRPQHPIRRGFAKQPSGLHFRAAVTFPKCSMAPVGRGPHTPEQDTQQDVGSKGKKESTKRSK